MHTDTHPAHTHMHTYTHAHMHTCTHTHTHTHTLHQLIYIHAQAYARNFPMHN